MAERVGRTLAIILGLRQANRYEEALIYIDDLFLQAVGLTSSFINSVSEETLLQMLSPLGELSIDKCLWVAALLKAEGEIYEDQGNTLESYYRYLKSLRLFLEVQLHERTLSISNFYVETEELLSRLEEYEVPDSIKSRLFSYYELTGRYAKAEDILFELLETDHRNREIFQQGIAFYERLQGKSDFDLAAGNLSRDEVKEGLAQLKQMKLR
jgi:tetratricopeptide (TPR) repeat protein